MIVTEMYNGQGLGNQLFCYVATRVIARDHGYEFGIKSPEKFKALDFLDVDFGNKVVGGSGPEGGPSRTLPEGIIYYYNELKVIHKSGADIRFYDENLASVPDNTKIDGLMQGERYIAHRKEEIREWLKVKEGHDCFEYAADDICVINFRGGEYVGLKDVHLTRTYWNNAMNHMREINPAMRFIVITDDEKTAKRYFPQHAVFHFSLEKDYAVIKNAHYLILSNSTFAWFPSWLNENVKLCIAPKYWARHNVSDGYWSLASNLTRGWMYQDREGKLHDYDSCRKELDEYLREHSEYSEQKRIKDNFLVVSNYYNDLSWVPEYTDRYLVYDQSDTAIHPPKLDTTKVIKNPHLGHNIRDYCTYVIDHYDTLPERVIFATGNIFPRHIARDRFDELVNSKNFTPFIDTRRHQSRWPVSFFSKDGLYCERNDSWYLDCHPTKYFHNYNDFLRFCFKNPSIPRYVCFAPGANYVVSKEHILKLPKQFYENLRTFVSHSENAIPGESHIIERALYTLWTSSFEVSDNMKKPIDESFKAQPKKRPIFVLRAWRLLIDYTWDAIILTKRVIRRVKRLFTD